MKYEFIQGLALEESDSIESLLQFLLLPKVHKFANHWWWTEKVVPLYRSSIYSARHLLLIDRRDHLDSKIFNKGSSNYTSPSRSWDYREPLRDDLLNFTSLLLGSYYKIQLPSRRRGSNESKD